MPRVHDFDGLGSRLKVGLRRANTVLASPHLDSEGSHRVRAVRRFQPCGQVADEYGRTGQWRAADVRYPPLQLDPLLGQAAGKGRK